MLRRHKIVKTSTLILGMGNDILKDDGIGPRLLNDLAPNFENPEIQCEIVCCGGLEIMEIIKSFDKVIFIDAIHTKDGKPGDIYYFKPSDFQETLHLSNLHDVGFLTALSLGNSLDMHLPADLHIIAVEIIEDMEFGEELTPELKGKYPEIKKEVAKLIKRIIR
jgi:hydrogenase maturation protease